jgi:hypothetical protein
MYTNPLWDQGVYIGSKVNRFHPGPIVPIGIFPHIRPTTPETTVVPNTTVAPSVAASAVQCLETLLVGLSIPSDFVRVGTGDVNAGMVASYKCSDATKYPVKADASALYSAVDHLMKLTCAADGASFTGVPAAFPTCTAITLQCPLPTLPAGMTGPDPAATTDQAIGIALKYNCSTGTDLLSTTNENGIEVTCKVVPAAAAPFYEAAFTDSSTWGTCAPPTGRKKRAILCKC